VTEKAGDGKAVIYCDAWQSSGDVSGPSTTQFYGLVKGLYIKRTVHLPAEIEKTNGYRGKDKNTVSWVTDLRNKEGLARTKAFVEGKDKGVGSVVFDASALTFSLPLKTPAPSEKTDKSEKAPLSEDVSTLKAEVSWVEVKKKMSTDSNSQTPALSDLEIGIKVSWDEDHKPFACLTPVLTNLTDDLNNNLVKSKTYSHQYRILGRRKNKDLRIRGETPANNATKLKHITGYVEVITEVITKTPVLENINQLVGKEFTGNPILDKLNCKIEDIHNNNMKIKIDGGYNTIQSVVLLGENGEKIKSSSRSSSGQNACTCSFRIEISQFDKCELEVVIDQKTLKVPFSLEELVLP